MLYQMGALPSKDLIFACPLFLPCAKPFRNQWCVSLVTWNLLQVLLPRRMVVGSSGSLGLYQFLVPGFVLRLHFNSVDTLLVFRLASKNFSMLVYLVGLWKIDFTTIYLCVRVISASVLCVCSLSSLTRPYSSQRTGSPLGVLCVWVFPSIRALMRFLSHVANSKVESSTSSIVKEGSSFVL